MYPTLLALLLLMRETVCLPTPRGNPSNTVPLASAGVPGLRGSSALLGYDPKNVLTTEDTHVQYQPVPGQTDEANLGTYLDFENTPNPQPVRGSKGGTDPGPRTADYDKINPDKLAPPGTDHGQTINAQWPMGLSHAKLGLDNAGWSRQENTVVMPDATKMAGVDMRLEAGAYRELHWHVAGEWALVLNRTARIAAIDEEGRSFVDDEFMLVFDDGAFSEDNTFLVTELMAHNPLSVLSKDLGIPVSAFKDLPAGELFIFPGTKAPTDISKQNITSSAGALPKSRAYSHHCSEQAPMEFPGGSVKTLDPQTFPEAKNFAAALVTVKPGAMREIHCFYY
ncbi:Bicupin, oxalate decarboxylase/oxidase [Tothia fuscella]|uniref:Bicupin, oxalate decarboxylase/oxidase n=1 Tax=Tothia fuscella TaxID=1048955 RepID=A0A9P4NH95_9PEZI|nr:Bicupin, oxalate decarboxylase/oxidase [Tothia fuscella]